MKKERGKAEGHDIFLHDSVELTSWRDGRSLSQLVDQSVSHSFNLLVS